MNTLPKKYSDTHLFRVTEWALSILCSALFVAERTLLCIYLRKGCHCRSKSLLYALLSGNKAVVLPRTFSIYVAPLLAVDGDGRPPPVV